MGEQENTWATVYCVAMRIEGCPGWIIEETLLEPETYREALTRQGHPILEAQLILQGGHRLEPGKPFEPTFASLMLVQNYGWAWDEVAKCWRAPGEPILPPPGESLPVSSIHFALESPEWGWLPVRIEAGNIAIVFKASDVFDPFPEMLDWLEAIARGETPRLHIDVEGTYYAFHTFPEPDHKEVRFVVVTDATPEKDEIKVLDIVLPRACLVRDFYKPLREFWRSEAYLSVCLQHWYRREPEDEDAPDLEQEPHKMYSAAIEQFLEQHC